MSDFFGISQGKSQALNIAAATVVATIPTSFSLGQRRLQRVQVLVAGTTAGAAYDSNATTGLTVANQIGTWPLGVGTYLIDMPCLVGIVVVPGAGQTVAVSFD